MDIVQSPTLFQMLSEFSRNLRPVSVLVLAWRWQRIYIRWDLQDHSIAHQILKRCHVDESATAGRDRYGLFIVLWSNDAFRNWNSGILFLLSSWSFLLLAMSESMFDTSTESDSGVYSEIVTTGWEQIRTMQRPIFLFFIFYFRGRSVPIGAMELLFFLILSQPVLYTIYVLS